MIMAAPSYLPAHTVPPILLVAMVFLLFRQRAQVGLWLTGKSGQLDDQVGGGNQPWFERGVDSDAGMRRGDHDMVSFALSRGLSSRVCPKGTIPFGTPRPCM